MLVDPTDFRTSSDSRKSVDLNNCRVAAVLIRGASDEIESTPTYLGVNVYPVYITSFPSRYRVLDLSSFRVKGSRYIAMYHIVFTLLLTENTATHVARIAGLRMSFCTIIIIKDRAKGKRDKRER